MAFGIAPTRILSSIQVILKETNFNYLQKSIKSIDNIFPIFRMSFSYYTDVVEIYTFWCQLKIFGE